MVSGKKGAKLEGNFPTEKSIFDFLGMEYREPKDRKDGRSVALLVQTPPPPQAEEVEAIGRDEVVAVGDTAILHDAVPTAPA